MLLCVLMALITLETLTRVGSNTPLVIFEGQSFALLLVHTAGRKGSAAEPSECDS